MQEWVQAAKAEQDLGTKLWFLTELSFGWRPLDQQTELRRRHVIHNTVGQPLGFVVRGRDIDAKKDAWIVAAIPPKVGEVPKAWLDHLPADANALLFPKLGTNEMHDHSTIVVLRHGFAAKHGLKWLNSRAMRHFVRATLVNSGMQEMDRNYWQGHAQTSMDATYGTAPEDIMTRQLQALPEGPMGTFIHKALVPGAKARHYNMDVQNLVEAFERGELDRADAMEEFERILKALNPRNGRKVAFMASLTR